MRGMTLAGRYDTQGHGNCPRSLALDLHAPGPTHDTGDVGFNPFRQHRRSPADVVMVAAGLLVCVALVAWALFA